MLKKTCPECGQANYSSTEFMLLFCRFCDASLQGVKAELADAKSEIAECLWCEERMMKTSNNVYVCPSCGWRYEGK